MPDGKSHQKTEESHRPETSNITDSSSELSRERRVAIIDMVLDIAGTLACIYHLNAPWRILLDILHLSWLVQMVGVMFFIMATLNLRDIIRINRILTSLS